MVQRVSWRVLRVKFVGKTGGISDAVVLRQSIALRGAGRSWFAAACDLRLRRALTLQSSSHRAFNSQSTRVALANYVFKPTAEEVARFIHSLPRGGGLTRR